MIWPDSGSFGSCLSRCARLLGCRRRRHRPDLQSQSREAVGDPGLQTPDWYSGRCFSICSQSVSRARVHPALFMNEGNRRLQRRHGLQDGGEQQRHHGSTGDDTLGPADALQEHCWVTVTVSVTSLFKTKTIRISCLKNRSEERITEAS